MPTTRLYRTNQYLRESDAVITDVREKAGKDMVACDISPFYPEGGGQPSDTGTITAGDHIFTVTHASCDDPESDVWHLTDAPAGTFESGDKVHLSIDWDVRFLNMQRHLGEHMLSGAMYSLYGGVNKGFHMGQGFITIDIDLGGRMLSDSELKAAERMVCQAIWADLPVMTSWFDDYESSLVMPVRKAVPHEGRISVVTVGDPSDPFDCIACCGTHPSSTAQVGLVAVYKSEPNKGMNRIFFDCGRAAMERLSSDSALLSEIARGYSCSTSDLTSRLQAEAVSITDMKARIASLSSYVREAEQNHILENISAIKSGSTPDHGKPAGEAGTVTYTYTSDLLSTDELLKLGFSVICKSADTVLAMMHPESRTVLLFSSSDLKCGKYIKEKAGEFGGRGGGRDDNARAVFPDLRSMKDFVSCIKKDQ